MTIKQKLVNLLDDVFALKGEGEETQTILLENAFTVVRDKTTFSGTSIFGLFDDLQDSDFFMKPLEYNIYTVEPVGDNEVTVDIYLKIPTDVNPNYKCILIRNEQTSKIVIIHENNGVYSITNSESEADYIKTLISESTR